MSSADLFQNGIFFKRYFRNSIRVSNCLDPDHDGHSVRPDLGPNHLPRLSVDKWPPARKYLRMRVCV